MSWQVGLCCLVCGCRLLEKWKKVQVCRMLNLIHQKIVCKESVKSSSLHEINVNSGIKKKPKGKYKKWKGFQDLHLLRVCTDGNTLPQDFQASVNANYILPTVSRKDKRKYFPSQGQREHLTNELEQVCRDTCLSFVSLHIMYTMTLLEMSQFFLIKTLFLFKYFLIATVKCNRCTLIPIIPLSQHLLSNYPHTVHF